MKILVAEDDPVSRTLMVGILNSSLSGYEVLPVNDGTEAWNTLQANPDTALAILDLTMPGLTGMELLDRMRTDSRFAKLPVIICTASSDRATVGAAAARGIRYFLVKPFSRTTVLEKVWQICKPATVAVPVLDDLSAVRQQLGIDRPTHRELVEHLVRMGDAWATGAQRATDFSRVRVSALIASDLHPLFTKAGAGGVATALKEAEQSLGVYRAKPLRSEEAECFRQSRLAGERVQRELDRLREAMHTIG